VKPLTLKVILVTLLVNILMLKALKILQVVRHHTLRVVIIPLEVLILTPKVA
jgi:hypothetical protein